MQPDLSLWTLIVTALGSIATAIAAGFAWNSARVAAAAAESAKRVAEVEAARREDEIRKQVSKIYLTTIRSDPNWRTREVSVTLENHGEVAVSNIQVDLIGEDSVGQTKIWRGHVDFLASNEVLQDTLYFENEQYDDEGFGRLLESDGATFGIGTDIGDFVWGLVFDDHTGRHWQTSRHGHLQQLTKRPADRSTQEIASSLGRDMERVDPKFDRLHLWAPQHLPDNPPPKLTEGLHLRGWPRYLFITGLQRAERALVWLKKNW